MGHHKGRAIKWGVQHGQNLLDGLLDLLDNGGVGAAAIDGAALDVFKRFHLRGAWLGGQRCVGAALRA